MGKGAQTTFTLTSTSGTYGTGLTLTASGGSGTGTVSYALDADGTASGCSISAGVLSATSVGTCMVTATRAADSNYNSVSSSETTVTFNRATSTAPTITDLPANGATGWGFMATISTTGDGTTSVTSSTPGVCTANGLTVSYVGTGLCILTAQVAQGTDYTVAGGVAQSFTVGGGTTPPPPPPALGGRSTPSTPVITDLPSGGGTYGRSFTATVSTDGDGTKSVTSSTPSVCVVNGWTVSFTGVGTCSLTAHVSQGTAYAAADGSAQAFLVYRAVPTAPTIVNLPARGTYEGNFKPAVRTTGDGTTSVTSNSRSVCVVRGPTVAYVGAGTCSLTAHVSQGADYAAAQGTPQTFTVWPPKARIASFTSTPVRFSSSGGTGKVVGVALFVTSWSITSPGLTEISHSVPFLDYTRCTATFHISPNPSAQARTWRFTFTISNARGSVSRTVSVTEAGR